MNESLKPCPFCGQKGQIKERTKDDRYTVGCHNGDCLTKPSFVYYSSKSMAAHFWNKRA